MSANYPDPPLQHPKFAFGELPDPPKNWKFCGETTDDVVKRKAFRRHDVEAMKDYHSWGIGFELPGGRRYSNEKILRGLIKLFYYQADQHRPKSWDEALDFTRDAGPRLLNVSIDDPSCPLPISRRYPDLPNKNAAPKAGYVRPISAPRSVPDSYLEQSLLPVSDTSPDGDGDGDGDGSGQPSGPRPRGRPRKNANIHGIGSSISDGAQSLAAAAPGFSATDPRALAIVEAVEKAVMQFVYDDLKRHPSAAPRIPRPFAIARTEADLQKAVVASFPAASAVTLKKFNGQLAFDPTGTPYRYLGRGPVWNALSAALDCMIIAGKFLDAGSTVVDRKEDGWQHRFTPIERAFIEATDINWDVLDHKTSIALRDQFLLLLAQADSQIQVGQSNPPWPMWFASTKSFAQFKYSYGEATNPCSCQGSASTRQTIHDSMVHPPSQDGDNKGVRMSKFVGRAFAPFHAMDCEHCGKKAGVVKARSFESLPLRMVVGMSEDVYVKEHTHDISFKYDDGSGNQKVAHYRWLGGIYFHKDHFRLYWTDVARGENMSGEVRMYDSLIGMGSILGSVPGAHISERVPATWYRHKPIPMLFYERIMDPEPAVLNAALHAVNSMSDAQKKDKPFFQQNTPWCRSEPVDGPVTQPWDPILATDGHRFHPAPSAYRPDRDDQFSNSGSHRQAPTVGVWMAASPAPLTQGFQPGFQASSPSSWSPRSNPALTQPGPQQMPQPSPQMNSVQMGQSQLPQLFSPQMNLSSPQPQLFSPGTNTFQMPSPQMNLSAPQPQTYSTATNSFLDQFNHPSTQMNLSSPLPSPATWRNHFTQQQQSPQVNQSLPVLQSPNSQFMAMLNQYNQQQPNPQMNQSIPVPQSPNYQMNAFLNQSLPQQMPSPQMNQASQIPPSFSPGTNTFFNYGQQALQGFNQPNHQPSPTVVFSTMPNPNSPLHTLNSGNPFQQPQLSPTGFSPRQASAAIPSPFPNQSAPPGTINPNAMQISNTPPVKPWPPSQFLNYSPSQGESGSNWVMAMYRPSTIGQRPELYIFRQQQQGKNQYIQVFPNQKQNGKRRIEEVEDEDDAKKPDVKKPADKKAPPKKKAHTSSATALQKRVTRSMKS